MSLNKDSVTNNNVEQFTRLTGCVKWFNNKSGYGFIYINDGVSSGTDLFVHHSRINIKNQQYKYLVQGEYVEFDVVKTDTNKHEWQAANVSGIKGGKLMCETRREFNNARNEYKTTKCDQNAYVEVPQRELKITTYNELSKPRQKTNTLRVCGKVPRESDNKEWTLTNNTYNRPNN